MDVLKTQEVGPLAAACPHDFSMLKAKLSSSNTFANNSTFLQSAFGMYFFPAGLHVGTNSVFLGRFQMSFSGEKNNLCRAFFQAS